MATLTCEKLYSIKEAAGILCLGRDSVVRLIQNGELECIPLPRMGGTGKNVKRLIREGALIRFLEASRKK